MAFSELIKSFDKIRDYMRDFYIYGFKARGDYTAKSARTYDDERRRIESYLAPHVRWETDKKGKRVYVSLDSSGVTCNPLYSAWKAKSFTDNDITLHFAMLAALDSGPMSIGELTDSVCELTGALFETQTVRLKANEYVKQGLLAKRTVKRADVYSLSRGTLRSLPADGGRLLCAIRFFQEAAPFGFVGSTILDRAEPRDESVFRFKHHYIVHTLEDGVLRDLLRAMREKRRVSLVHHSARGAEARTIAGIPLQIFVSAQSGRRYVCVYSARTRRFSNYRLDYIKKVSALEPELEYDALREALDRARPMCWGVSFGASERGQTLRMTLRIDESTEGYVLERLRREGRQGTVERAAPGTFVYTAAVFDAAEMMAWVKSFTGRIISLDCTNQAVAAGFYSDMRRIAELYGVDG